MLLLGGHVFRATALQGQPGLHDPSTIIKHGNTYWTFATGDGIYSLYSTDLVHWRPGPRPVFPNNGYPSWINSKVPGFAGLFWAPECFFMNGKYYLYYSCSTFGSGFSAIGLVTNPTLDPNSPDYRWTDQGEVISSTAINSSQPNAIDPAIFRDANNRVWLTYGSYFGGIRVVELNPTSGKLLNTNQFAVGNNGAEAAYIKEHDGYYYLFLNRGTCCQGALSTYHILVGRSLSPTGPFLDQQGVDLNNGGGTTLLSGSGRYRGPGHAGILEEGGVNYFSYHYYDSYDGGVPKLGLAQLIWTTAGWPSISRDWVTAGRYVISTAQTSGLVWEAGCASGSTPITQNTFSNQPCQQWNFAALGNGDYRVTNQQGGLTASVAGCSDAAGAKLQLGAYTDDDCQRFHIDRAANGTLVFASLNGNRVVEVPNASTAAGQQLGLWDYNGCSCQRWSLTPTNTPLAVKGAQLQDISIYPVPAGQQGFTVELGTQPIREITQVEVRNLLGAVVYQHVFGKQQTTLSVAAGLQPGVYVVCVRRPSGSLTQKITVL
ncbi:family 43 glycosylhydrolase [Hymenobacter sp. 5516J-16]|nr:family 43 glycosylhydrolase [Hymenobacter sp. 5516J-16]UOQ77742.1 family 43 glycosylhydrolase [Hymenobacter sp. 5516J-16]